MKNTTTKTNTDENERRRTDNKNIGDNRKNKGKTEHVLVERSKHEYFFYVLLSN